VLTYAASWGTVILLLGVLVIGLAARLLAEWQRRKTLVALIQHAPGGTVIMQNRGRGGPAMRIEIGSSANGPKDQNAPRSDGLCSESHSRWRRK
jgi:hypothetical protein